MNDYAFRPCPHCDGGARKPCVYCANEGRVTVDMIEKYTAWLRSRLTTDTQPMKPHEKK